MSDIRWIKVLVSMFEDEKIKLIQSMPEGDSLLIIWLRLLTQAGKCNSGGYIHLQQMVPYTPQMLATIFNKPVNIIDFALTTLHQFGMIETDNNGIFILNWEKHQNVEGMEKVRLLERERKRKQRERQKVISGDDQSRDSHGTSHQSHATDIELEIEIEKDIEIKNPSKTQYAEFVFMTQEQYENLIVEWGKSVTDDYIERLDNYIGSSGKTKKYKDHYRTLRNWYKRDHPITVVTASKNDHQEEIIYDEDGVPLNYKAYIDPEVARWRK